VAAVQRRAETQVKQSPVGRFVSRGLHQRGRTSLPALARQPLSAVASEADRRPLSAGDERLAPVTRADAGLVSASRRGEAHPGQQGQAEDIARVPAQGRAHRGHAAGQHAGADLSARPVDRLRCPTARRGR
jgi:hypothetical protein